MTQYADYKYYKEEYKGNMPLADFDRLAKIASTQIKLNTFNRIDETDVPEEVKFCTCVIVDKMLATMKNEGKSSESVGPWSVSYTSSQDGKKAIENTMVEFLANVVDKNGTPLLYRGC